MGVLPVRQQAGRLWVYLHSAQRASPKLVRALDDEGVLRLYLGEGEGEMMVFDSAANARANAEIKSLRDKVEELAQASDFDHSEYKRLRDELKEQLAALEAREAALREALETVLAPMSLISYENLLFDSHRKAREALALQQDTTALDRACKLYAAGVLEEKAATVGRHYSWDAKQFLEQEAEQLRKEAGE